MGVILFSPLKQLMEQQPPTLPEAKCFRFYWNPLICLVGLGVDEGWIKVYRSIQDHWVFKDSDRFKAWMTILMEVNHAHQRVMIRGEIYECDIGQSLLSYDSWAKKFGKEWTKQKVRTFFSLLENDQMLTHEGLHYTTRVTVCNYKAYQSKTDKKQHTDNTPNNTPITHGQHTDNTPITPNKNDKNENNGKNVKNNTPPTPKGEIEIPDSLLGIDGFTEAWGQWLLHLKEKKKPPTPQAQKLQLKKLATLGDPIKSINQSIERNYQGIFECSEKQNQNNQATDWDDVARNFKTVYQ